MSRPSLWQRADELARLAAAHQGPAAKLLEAQAILFRDLCEMAGLRNEGIDHPLTEGQWYEITLKVRARVIDLDAEKGDPKQPDLVTNYAYELQLEDRNFLGGRKVSVDADEIADARISR